MKTVLSVESFAISDKSYPVSTNKKLNKFKIVLNTNLGEIRGEINFTDNGEKNLFEERENYTVHAANSPEMDLQNLITNAKQISWKRKAGKIVLG